MAEAVDPGHRVADEATRRRLAGLAAAMATMGGLVAEYPRDADLPGAGAFIQLCAHELTRIADLLYDPVDRRDI